MSYVMLAIFFSQIQGVLVEGIPSLLSKCVSALTISSWQPVPTPQYFSCLSHLSWLVSRAGVDAKTKATLRKMTSRGAPDRKVAADELLRAVIPSGIFHLSSSSSSPICYVSDYLQNFQRKI